jgi:hypothetical protein
MNVAWLSIKHNSTSPIPVDFNFNEKEKVFSMYGIKIRYDDLRFSQLTHISESIGVSVSDIREKLVKYDLMTDDFTFTWHMKYKVTIDGNDTEINPASLVLPRFFISDNPPWNGIYSDEKFILELMKLP